MSRLGTPRQPNPRDGGDDGGAQIVERDVTQGVKAVAALPPFVRAAPSSLHRRRENVRQHGGLVRSRRRLRSPEHHPADGVAQRPGGGGHGWVREGASRRRGISRAFHRLVNREPVVLGHPRLDLFERQLFRLAVRPGVVRNPEEPKTVLDERLRDGTLEIRGRLEHLTPGDRLEQLAYAAVHAILGIRLSFGLDKVEIFPAERHRPLVPRFRRISLLRERPQMLVSSAGVISRDPFFPAHRPSDPLVVGLGLVRGVVLVVVRDVVEIVSTALARPPDPRDLFVPAHRSGDGLVVRGGLVPGAVVFIHVVVVRHIVQVCSTHLARFPVPSSRGVLLGVESS